MRTDPNNCGSVGNVCPIIMTHTASVQRCTEGKCLTNTVATVSKPIQVFDGPYATGTPIVFQGRATPGALITVPLTASWSDESVVADAAGAWSLTKTAPAAGQMYYLFAVNSTVQDTMLQTKTYGVNIVPSGATASATPSVVSVGSTPSTKTWTACIQFPSTVAANTWIRVWEKGQGIDRLALESAVAGGSTTCVQLKSAPWAYHEFDLTAVEPGKLESAHGAAFNVFPY